MCFKKLSSHTYVRFEYATNMASDYIIMIFMIQFLLQKIRYVYYTFCENDSSKRFAEVGMGGGGRWGSELGIF
jgi:hypothetical protein